MFDEFSRFQYSASRGAEGLVALFRIFVAIISRPKRLLAAVIVFALFGAVLSLHYGWLILVVIALLGVVFLILRYGE
jgi:hypothetical protein